MNLIINQATFLIIFILVLRFFSFLYVVYVLSTSSASLLNHRLLHGEGTRTAFSNELVMYQKSNEGAQRTGEISDTNQKVRRSSFWIDTTSQPRFDLRAENQMTSTCL